MAQTITHYTAQAVGGVTLYCYEQPNENSRATRIQRGTALKLPPWYACEMPNSMVRIIHPQNGWMFLCNVTDIQPVYGTIIGKCKPPTVVSLDPSTRKLTFDGGEGGELNTLTGFGISWRDREINSAAWSAWTEDVFTADSSITVNVPLLGKIRQFRVRTRGSAGSDYFSGYVLCKTQLITASVPTPVILYPMSGTSSRSAAPWLMVHCPAASAQQELYVQIDGGDWEHLTTCEADETTESHTQLTNLAPGLHTLRVKLLQANGAESPMDSVLFTREDFSWSRPIAAGDVIASPHISHRRDLLELLETLNVIRNYYGLPSIEALPGYVGRLADWQKQITALQQGLDEVYSAKEEILTPYLTAAWPTASVINQLRKCMEDI